MGFKVTASYEDKKEEFINSFMKRFRDIVFATHARAKIYAPSNDGNLRSKITINDLGEGKYEIVSNASYSAAMEYGTKPFTAPITRSFVSVPYNQPCQLKTLPSRCL